MSRIPLTSLVLSAILSPLALSQISFQPAVPITVPGLSGPRAVAAGDVDGDADRDLVIAFGTSNAVAILANDGTGAFTLVASAPVGAGPRAIALADLDSDGDLDAATANQTASTISIVWNAGGTWVAGPTLPCGSGPRGLLAADLDANGVMDLVSADSGANTVSVFLGTGGGTFAAAVPYVAGAAPRDIDHGDFDGDGHEDLVVACANANQIVFLAGLGNGTFAAPVATPVGGQLPVALAVGDIDGDGDRDVASSNFLAPSLTVFASSGNGSFAATSFGLGTHFQDLALADFDFDGDLDAAGLDVGFNHVQFAENLGAGTFFAGLQVAVGASTSSLISADFDGDFIPDVVTADFGAGLSLLVNALPGPVMGPAGAGNTPDGAGGSFDALLVNGSAGGPARRVDATAGALITIGVLPPPLAAGPSPFLLWGTLGAPTPSTQTTLPFGLGEMAFMPFHLDPANPALFVLANGFFFDPAAVLAPPPAPWSLAVPGPGFPITATLQGLIQDAGGLRLTNGIILNVQ